jgi:triphosphoribosyl-dephospho-CoA synthetase
VTRKLATRKTTRAEAAGYLKKAEQFYRTMTEAVSNEDWDAVGLNAIHCMISANDALLGFRHGVRSAGKGHAEASELLAQLEKGETARRSVSRFDRAINKKNLVEYEGRALSPSEGRKMATDAERFLAWVRDLLK